MGAVVQWLPAFRVGSGAPGLRARTRARAGTFRPHLGGRLRLRMHSTYFFAVSCKAPPTTSDYKGLGEGTPEVGNGDPSLLSSSRIFRQQVESLEFLAPSPSLSPHPQAKPFSPLKSESKAALAFSLGFKTTRSENRPPFSKYNKLQRKDKKEIISSFGLMGNPWLFINGSLSPHSA